LLFAILPIDKRIAFCYHVVTGKAIETEPVDKEKEMKMRATDVSLLDFNTKWRMQADIWADKITLYCGFEPRDTQKAIAEWANGLLLLARSQNYNGTVEQLLADVKTGKIEYSTEAIR
jgi:hypothetical protein